MANTNWSDDFFNDVASSPQGMGGGQPVGAPQGNWSDDFFAQNQPNAGVFGAPQAPAQTATPTLSDYGLAMAAGVGDLPSAAGFGLRMLGANGAADTLSDIGKSTQDYWTEQMTPAGRASMETPFLDKENNIQNWRAIPMAVAQSLPGTVMMGLGGKAVLAGAKAAGALGGAAKVLQGLGVGEKAIGAALPKVASGIAYGGAEGVYSGLSNAEQTYREILATPQKLLDQNPNYQALMQGGSSDADARKELAYKAGRDVAAKTALSTGLISAATGGGMFGQMENGVEGGLLSRAAKGFATEGLLQEAPQSWGEQIIQNQATQQYGDPSRGTYEGALNAAATGAGSGGLMGSMSSVFTGKPDGQSPPPKSGQPPDQSTAERDQAPPKTTSISSEGVRGIGHNEIMTAAKDRLAMLDRKMNGTPDQEIVDPTTGQKIRVRGDLPQFASDAEKSERSFLSQNLTNPDALAKAYGYTLTAPTAASATTAESSSTPQEKDKAPTESAPTNSRAWAQSRLNELLQKQQGRGERVVMDASGNPTVDFGVAPEQLTETEQAEFESLNGFLQQPVAPQITDHGKVFTLHNIDDLGGLQGVRTRLNEAGIPDAGTQTRKGLQFPSKIKDSVLAALQPQEASHDRQSIVPAELKQSAGSEDPQAGQEASTATTGTLTGGRNDRIGSSQAIAAGGTGGAQPIAQGTPDTARGISGAAGRAVGTGMGESGRGAPGSAAQPTVTQDGSGVTTFAQPALKPVDNDRFHITNVRALGGMEAVQSRLKEAGVPASGTQIDDNTLQFHDSQQARVMQALTVESGPQSSANEKPQALSLPATPDVAADSQGDTAIADLQQKATDAEAAYTTAVDSYNDGVRRYKDSDAQGKAQMQPEMDALQEAWKVARGQAFQAAEAVRKAQKSADNEARYSTMPVGTRVPIVPYDESKFFFTKLADGRWQRTWDGKAEDVFKGSHEMQGEPIADKASQPALPATPTGKDSLTVEPDTAASKLQARPATGLVKGEAPYSVYDDPRMQRSVYRDAIQSFKADLTPGGDVQYLTDEHGRITGRTKSTNPDWFKNLPKSDKLSVKQAWAAIDKATNGKKLGARESRFISHLLDEIQIERSGSENVNAARDRLEAQRERMRKERASADLIRQTLGLEADDHINLGYERLESDYDADASHEARIIGDLASRYEALPDADLNWLESLLEKDIPDAEVVAQLQEKMYGRTLEESAGNAQTLAGETADQAGDLFPAADRETRQAAERQALEESQREQQRRSNATQDPRGGGLLDQDNRQADAQFSLRPQEDQEKVNVLNEGFDRYNAAHAARGTGSYRGRVAVASEADVSATSRGNWRLAKAIAALFGHHVIVVRSESGATLNFDGVVNPTDPSTFFIASDAESPVSRVVAHELVHSLRANAPRIYDSLVKSLQEVYNQGAVLEHLKSRGYVNRAGQSISDQNEEEWVADFVSDVIHKPDALVRVAFAMNKHRAGSGAKFLARVQQLIERIREGVASAGFNTAAHVSDIKKAEEAVIEALARYAAHKAAGTQPTTTRQAAPRASNRADRIQAASAREIRQADQFEKDFGIRPYYSEGQIDIPVDTAADEPKFSLKLKSEWGMDARLGLPLNKNGTVSLYFPTTNDHAIKIAQSKKLTSLDPSANRLHLTNESSAWVVGSNPGKITQRVGEAHVLVHVNPELLNILEEHEDGRKDFFIPIAEGDTFFNKMRMTRLFTLKKGRDEAISPDATFDSIAAGIDQGIKALEGKSFRERVALVRQARALLRKYHNISTLLTENGKLEKTRVGDYGLKYDGHSVASLGLGLAAAQRLNSKKLNACLNSAICKALCLGDTSGQNLLYGGFGPFRSAARLSQYLKTEALVIHPKEFGIVLAHEIAVFKANMDRNYDLVRNPETNKNERVARDPIKTAIRLNVTSDIPASVYKSLMRMFPDVMFYDYTKLNGKPISDNHHLTYSSTGVSQVVNGKAVHNPHSNWTRMRSLLNAGNNVAMAFSDKNSMPEWVVDEETGQRFKVWNGDNYDARFLDPKQDDGVGMIVGLTNKDRTTKPEEAASKHNGFFVHYDPKEDGDTVTIKDQKRFIENHASFGKSDDLKFSNRNNVLDEDLRREYDEIRAKYADTPQWLKAPNGQPSNLNERQWVMVRTPRFKAWFGDWEAESRQKHSQVVDDNGEPMVVYHATDDDITIFYKAKLGSATVKNTDSKEALRIAKAGFWFNSHDLSEKIGASKTLEVFLNIRNPRRYRSVLGSMWNKAGQRKTLIPNGYDGIIVPDDEFGGVSYIAKSPTQIKSATGNTGQFDPNNPDIRFSNRQTETPDRDINKVMPAFDNASGNFNPDLDEYWIKQGQKQINGERMPDAEYYTAVAEYANEWRIHELLEKLGWRRRGASNVSKSTYFEKNVELDEPNEDGEDTLHYEVRLSDHDDYHPAGGSIQKRFQINFRQGHAQWSDADITPDMSTDDALSALKDALEIDRSAPISSGAFNPSNPDIRFSNRQTETPEFKKWFGDSKAVDENGKPLILGHSTKRDFTEFKTKHGGTYLTEESGEYENIFGGEYAGGTHSLYVKMERPFDARWQHMSEDQKNELRSIINSVVDQGDIEDAAKRLDVSLEDADPFEVFTDGEFYFGYGRQLQNSVIEAIHAKGYDGVIFPDAIVMGVPHVSYVVFDPTQIKSATDNTGQFDPNNPDIRFSNRQMPGHGDLLIQHNLSAENLLHAHRMGGIAVPSLAVTKKENPLTGFGEITLLGSKEMADPKGYAKTKVFGADIYSPRYPRVNLQFTPAIKKRGEAMLKQGMEATGSNYIEWSNIEQDGLRELESTPAFAWQFLTEKGITPNVSLDAKGNISQWDSRYSMQRQVRELNLEDELEAAAKAFAKELAPNERIFQGFTSSGNRRYVDHTLDNVVKILKKELRGGENIDYGVGTIRSRFTPEFKSIDQIRKAKDRLLGKAEFEQVKKEIDDDFDGIMAQLAAYHGYSNNFGFIDIVSSTLYDAAKMGLPRALQANQFEGVPSEVQQEIAQFLTRLRNLPTEYFEAKILREVDLAEFAAAVVPDGVKPEVIKALESRGVTDIRYYKLGDEADRTAKIGELEHLRFSNRKNVLGEEVTPTWTQTPQSKWGQKLHDFLVRWQDSHYSLKQIQQDILKAGGTIRDEFDPRQKEELYHGKAEAETQDFLGKELRPLLKSMIDKHVSMDELGTYLWNRHAEERNEQIAKLPNSRYADGGSGILTEDARDYLRNLPREKRTALESLARRVDAISGNTRRILVESGLETQETIDAWEGAYANYVPLQREELDYIGDVGTGLGQGFSVKGSSSRRAIGSDKPVAVSEILANVAMQRERAIVRSEKKRVGMAAYGMAILNPNALFWLPVMPGKNNDELSQGLHDMGLSDAELEALMAEPKAARLDKNNQLTMSLIRNRDNVLPVRIQGKDRFLFFNPHNEQAMSVVRNLKNLDTGQLHPILNAMASLPLLGTRWQAAVNTAYSIVFGLTNFLRDTGGAMINLTSTPLAGHQVDVLKNIPAAMRGAWQALRAERDGKTAESEWAKRYEDYRHAGGKTGYRDMFKDSTERAKRILKEIDGLKRGKLMTNATAFVELIHDYNDTIENAVRLSAYQVALDNGFSQDRAASIAKNLTVNFNRKGNWGTQANAIYAFFNASVQGTSRLAETLAGPAGRKIVAGGLILGVVDAMLMAMAGYDDDEPPEFVRERNFVIPLPSGKYASVPYPLGFHVLPNIGRQFTEMATSAGEGAGAKLGELLTTTLSALNPVGSAGTPLQTLSPTIADPFAALAENKDAFGKRIFEEERSSLEPTPGPSRLRNIATPWGQGLSELLNWATGGDKYTKGAFSPTPDQVDYLIQQTLGGIGRDVSKVAQTSKALATGDDLPAYKIPIVGKFYGDTTGMAPEANRFYENVTKINEAATAVQAMRKDQMPVDDFIQRHPEAKLGIMADHVRANVSKLRKLKESKMESGAPRPEIRKIDEQITQSMRRLNDKYQQLTHRAP